MAIMDKMTELQVALVLETLTVKQVIFAVEALQLVLYNLPHAFGIPSVGRATIAYVLVLPGPVNCCLRVVA